MAKPQTNPPHVRHILAASMIATVVVTLDVSVVNIAVPQFERTFGSRGCGAVGAQRLHAGVRIAAA